MVPLQIVTNKTDQIKEWIKNKTESQEKLPLWETPAFASDEVSNKWPKPEYICGCNMHAHVECVFTCTLLPKGDSCICLRRGE